MRSLNSRPTIIFISTNITEEEACFIKNKGFNIILIKESISIEEMMLFDLPFQVELNNTERTFELVNKLCGIYNVERILTFNEYYVPLVAQLAQMFKIPYWGLNIEAAMNCRHKKNAKKIFETHNIPSSKYMIINSQKEVLSVLSYLDFPLVVKPSNDSGSRNVYICKNLQELMDSVKNVCDCNENLFGQPIDKEFIVEEFIDGKEYSVETITIDGKNSFVAITAKETINAIEIAHTVPAILNEKSIQDIECVVDDALKALKVDFGVTHTEIKITPHGPQIIEVNGRIGGDNIDEIVSYVTGVNLRKTAIQIAIEGVNAKIYLDKKIACSATVCYLIADKDGIVKLSFNNMLTQLESFRGKTLYVNNNQYVKKTTSNIDRIGYFVVTGDTKNYSRTVAENVFKNINLTIEE